MRRGRILFGLGIAATAAGTFAVVPAAATGGGGPVAQTVLGSGSDTTQFMMASLDNLYLFSPGCQQIPNPGGTAWFDFSCLSPDPSGVVRSENYEHDQTHEAYFLGSGNGIHQVCNQGVAGNATVDFARSSRAPGSSDCTGLHFVAYARDGIPIEVFRSFTNNGTDAGPCAGKTNCISQQQAKDIWHLCSITDWNQIDSSIPAGTTIDMYTPQAGSGTRGTFDNFLGGTNFSETCIDARGTSYQQSHVVPENSNVSILNNGDSSTAMFPFSFGVWSTQVKGKNGALLTAIDGIAANAKTIANLSFPYGRYLFNVYCFATSTGCAASNPGGATQAARNYVGEEGWICKPGSGSWSSDGGPHTTNPVTGNNYQKDIAAAIKSFGFVPNPLGSIGGGDTNKDYCRLFTT
jgi:ABC-type phosphate transport system substrate-binding protein